MAPRWLIGDWRGRLRALRSLAPDAAPEMAWFRAIRVRILTYLLVRYETAPQAPEHPAPLARIQLQALCLVEDPTGPPPRRGAAIAPILHDIRRCNIASRPRWWFWL